MLNPIPAEQFSNLLFKSIYTDDPRLSAHAQSTTLKELPQKPPGIALYGYPDDEGVKANNGRPGCNLGPIEIRKAFYSLTPSRSNQLPLYDLGHLNLTSNLSTRQKTARALAKEVFMTSHRLLTLGGGNDYAYSDGSAFLEVNKSKNPVLINFDAHLDLRPLERGPNSGTPFFQILEEHKKIKFNLIEIGIQKHCNAIAHLEYAKKHNVKIKFLQDCSGRLQKLLSSLQLKKRPVFVCIDMDVFSSAFAPGVSAPNPTGLDPNEFVPFFYNLCVSSNICGLGIYETAPQFDIDNRTSRLAAIIAHTFYSGVKIK